MSKRVIGVLMSFVVLSILCFNAAPVLASQETGVTFYSDPFYTRNDITLDVGSYTYDQLRVAGIYNDDISSIKVPQGYTVRVFQHDNFRGNHWTFNTSTPDFRDYGCNDIMSSVVISIGNSVDGVTFYSDPNYNRNDVTLGVGRYTQTQLNAAGVYNDDVSSIKVPQGYRVRVFQHDYFRGSYWTFYTDTSDLRAHRCNDVISSVEITRN